MIQWLVNTATYWWNDVLYRKDRLKGYILTTNSQSDGLEQVLHTSWKMKPQLFDHTFSSPTFGWLQYRWMTAWLNGCMTEISCLIWIIQLGIWNNFFAVLVVLCFFLSSRSCEILCSSSVAKQFYLSYFFNIYSNFFVFFKCCSYHLNKWNNFGAVKRNYNMVKTCLELFYLWFT